MSNNFKLKVTTGNHSRQTIIGNQQINSSNNERFDTLEKDNQQLRSQIFELRDQIFEIRNLIQEIMGDVIPGTLDQLLDARIGEFCNEKGSSALFLMEKQMKRPESYLNSKSIYSAILNRFMQILNKDTISLKFNALHILRYIVINIFDKFIQERDLPSSK
jgi:hypothetical protein